jgi:hypothetical protein
MPRSANINVSEFMRKDFIAGGGSAGRLDEFHIVSVVTRPDAVVIHFDLSLTMP